MPILSFDFVDTGAGNERSIHRNVDAFEAIEMVPRFGATPGAVVTEVELFGRTYSLPVGIAPMGLANLAWPGADVCLATAAQAARIPFVLATGASMSIEHAAELAPDVFWFQLYQMPRDDSRIAFDLVDRADRAGAHALVLTIDSAARAKRPRDLRNGLVPPFRLSPKMAFQAAMAPAWLLALARLGFPRFENLVPYLQGKPTAWETAAFAVREITGAFSWDDVMRLRDRWPRALVVKGLTHPQDAEKAVAIGADGVWISNHGGRLFDSAPATIDMLPQVAAVVGQRATLLLDSGVRDGLDVVRARALGAKAVFAGRAFLFATAALGAAGPRHMIELIANDLGSALRFVGLPGIGEVDAAVLRRMPSRYLPEPGKET
jgi:L-lactate dehydrogenase (cytochrome)